MPSFVPQCSERGLKPRPKTQHAGSQATSRPSPGPALCCPVCLHTSPRCFPTSIHLLLLSLTNRPSFFLSALQPRNLRTFHPTQLDLPQALPNFPAGFPARDGRHFSAREKTASLLSSLLPNHTFSSPFPLPLLLLSNLALNIVTVSWRTPAASKTPFPPGRRWWTACQLFLDNHKAHRNSHLPAIPAHASHPNTTTAAYLKGFGNLNGMSCSS